MGLKGQVSSHWTVPLPGTPPRWRSGFCWFPGPAIPVQQAGRPRAAWDAAKSLQVSFWWVCRENDKYSALALQSAHTVWLVDRCIQNQVNLCLKPSPDFTAILGRRCMTLEPECNMRDLTGLPWAPKESVSGIKQEHCPCRVTDRCTCISTYHRIYENKPG